VTSAPTYTVEAVEADGWADLRAFFGPSGAYSQCWCTWWRQTSSSFDAGCHDRGAGNRALLESLVESGRRPGLVARTEGGEPVGWVTVAPRAEFVRLARSPLLRGDDAVADPNVWSVPCFWVPRALRGQGVATALLGAAVDHAAGGGARVVEAYPVDTATRLPAADVFTGTVALFEGAGFVLHRRPVNGRRVVMRHDVARRPRRRTEERA